MDGVRQCWMRGDNGVLAPRSSLFLFIDVLAACEDGKAYSKIVQDLCGGSDPEENR